MDEVFSIDGAIATRPAVRVNQLGYLAGCPAGATLVTDEEEPVGFVVRDRASRTVRAGRSEPWPVRPDPSSGLLVHRLDLTGLPPGGGYRVETSTARSHPFRVDAHLYAGLGRDALAFFDLVRSVHGDRHVPAWTGPDAERLYPGWRCPGTFDVSGGWYDAGDYGKYVTSGAISVWQLLGTPALLPPGSGSVALADRVRTTCRWQLDWLLRMQVPPGRPLAGMVFHRVHGTQWSPLPGRADQDPTERVLHRPSTGATLHLAAVGAHAARAYAAADPAYARRLLGAARVAWAAASEHPVLLAPDDHALHGGGPYGDDDLADDWYWAAAELWLTTREEPFRTALLASPLHHADVFDPAGFDFDAVAGPARLDLATDGADLPDHDDVVVSVQQAADRLVTLQQRQPWGQPYAPVDGWAWGSNGRVLNNLVVLASAGRLTGEPRYRDAVSRGMDYLLGRNALGQGYVTGHGSDDSHRLRSRQFGHALDPRLPPPPPGTVAGGACSQRSPDFPYDPRLVGRPPQCCYLDEPTSEVTNDLCIRWNAPLVWVTTYLDQAEPEAYHPPF